MKDDVVSSFTTFMAIIRDYNAKLRPMNTRYQEEVSVKKHIDVLVVRAEEFGSVLDHVIHNFITPYSTLPNTSASGTHALPLTLPENVLKASTTLSQFPMLSKNWSG